MLLKVYFQALHQLTIGDFILFQFLQFVQHPIAIKLLHLYFLKFPLRFIILLLPLKPLIHLFLPQPTFLLQLSTLLHLMFLLLLLPNYPHLMSHLMFKL